MKHCHVELMKANCSGIYRRPRKQVGADQAVNADGHRRIDPEKH